MICAPPATAAQMMRADITKFNKRFGVVKAMGRGYVGKLLSNLFLCFLSLYWEASDELQPVKLCSIRYFYALPHPIE